MQHIAVEIAKRSEHNPLITPKAIPARTNVDGMTVKRVLNPGVFKYDKKTWLIVRVAEGVDQTKDSINLPVYDKDGDIEILKFKKGDPLLEHANSQAVTYNNKKYNTSLSHLRLMCSDDGISFYEPEGYEPIFGDGPLESFGLEDCRVTEIKGIYYLTYTMASANGVGVGLMYTRDWKHLDHKGMIFPPDNRDCALFEEKIRDKYYALHRPLSRQDSSNNLWLAESPDLQHWGNYKCIATTRENKWDSASIAAGASPIQTPKGWLVIYNGADQNDRHCLGALLLDINEPSRIIGRSEFPIMEPAESYELTGFSDHRIFTNGHLVIGDRVQLYYAAADEVICRADLSIKEIFSALS
jgi:beta-1,2-mannobiose phosphorylase / 1,2-beta-oligomannan phosphorylase